LTPGSVFGDQFAGRLFDPADVVRTRLYPPGRDLQLLIPGMAAHAPLREFAPAFDGRFVIIDDATS
jgi:hypothetical protein